MHTGCPRVLRLVRPARTVSAEVFEQTFAAALTPAVEITSVPHARWLRDVVGERYPDGPDAVRAGQALAEALAGFDLLSVSSDVAALLPGLLTLRAAAGADWRLLHITHSPAASSLDLAAIAGLLRTDDVVVAPTRSAAATIVHVCPALAPVVTAIAHPVFPLPAAAGQRPPRTRLVSLTRIHPAKVLHRQLDALAVLRAQGRDAELVVAGPLTDDTGAVSSYARTLFARAHRLGIGQHVSFPGEVRGDAAKAELLHGAAALLNLSVTVEESFGKSIVEAQWAGVPTVATRWDGLTETVGAAGVTVPTTDWGGGLDVDPDVLAAAIGTLLDAPLDPAGVRAQAAASDPVFARARYAAALSRPAQRNALAPAPGGLLARTAPLTALTPSSLSALYLDDWTLELSDAPGHATVPTPRRRLATLVYAGTRRPLEAHLRGTGDVPAELGSGTAEQHDDLAAAVAASVRARATTTSLAACLGHLAESGQRAEVGAARRALAAVGGLGRLGAPGVLVDVAITCLLDGTDAALTRGLAEPGLSDRHADLRLQQLLRLGRETGRLPEVLPAVDAWLEAHPDDPTSPSVRTVLASVTAHVAAHASAPAALPALPAGLLAQLGVELGATERVEPLGPRGRSLLIESATGPLVIRVLGAAGDRLEVVAAHRLAAGIVPPVGAPLLGTAEHDGLLWGAAGWLAGRPAGASDRRAVLELLGRLRACHPREPVRRLETRWLDRLAHLLARRPDDAAALDLLDRLAGSPPQGQVTLAHGDVARPNMVVTPHGLRLIDWEECGTAVAGFDAGWLLALTRVGAGGLGWTRDELFDELLGLDFDRAAVTWFESLGVLRLLGRSDELRLDAAALRSVRARLSVEVDALV